MGHGNRLTRRTALRAGATAAGLLGVGTRVGTARSNRPCSYQVDFVAGDPIETLGGSEDDFYGRQNRLIQYLHGDADGVTERDAWLNSLDPVTREAVTAEPIQLEGGTASVEFRVAEGEEYTLSLVVYTLPGGTFSFGTAGEQELADAATATFGPGTHRLEASLPCATTAPTRVVASDLDEGDLFGGSVALDGATLFVGAPGADDALGAAYAFTGTDDGWTRSDRLAGEPLPPEFRDPAPRFGSGVAVDGDTAFVSEPGYPTAEVSGYGVVFVYDRDSGTDEWVRRQRLDPGPANTSAWSVDLDGTTGITTGDGGAVYVFERHAGTWDEVESFFIGSGEYAPAAAALSGDTIVLGSYTGYEAYVFERSDAGEWEAVERFTPDEGIGSDSLFGIAVAVDGDRVAVADSTKTDDPGAVYVYERSESGWDRAAKVPMTDTTSTGWPLALDGDRLFVSLEAERTDIFEPSGGTWTRTRTLDYGGVLALDGSRVVFGNPEENDETGAVYVVDL